MRQTMKVPQRELKLLHVVYRNAASAPPKTYPNDPYLTSNLWPIGWGQLTNDGKKNMYKHGQYLRQRYNDFLGKYYSPERYHIQTTETDRTISSAQCINAGLWPPVDKQKWCDKLDWQPIPVHTQPKETDNLLLVKHPHPEYAKELTRIMKSTEVVRKLIDNDELFQALTKYTGKSINNFNDVREIYAILTAELACDLELPQWTSSFYPGKISDLVALSYSLQTSTDSLNRYKGGVFIQKILKDWKELEEKQGYEQKEPKVNVYVGHDTTIVNIMSALRNWKATDIPQYSANIIFECYYNPKENKYELEIYFRNNPDPFIEPTKLCLSGNDGYCSLEKFIIMTKFVIPLSK